MITDVSSLSGLTSLTRLDLSTNAITDISPLSGLSDLTRLDLGGNVITDVTPLSGLTGLTNLGLDCNCLTSIDPLTRNTGLGQGDVIALRWNALSESTLDRDVAALRDRGVKVEVSRTTPGKVGSPMNVSVTPGDQELTLTWDSPGFRVDITTYEVRWRSAIGAFSDWTVVPCSPKHRHEVTGLVNGTTDTVEVRAAGNAGNGVARVAATPRSGGPAVPAWTMLWADLTAPDDVPSVLEINPYDGYEIQAKGAWPMLVEGGAAYEPSVYLRELRIVPTPPPEELAGQVEIRLSMASIEYEPPPSSRFGRRMLFAVHDVGLEEALVDAEGLPLVTAKLDAVGNGWFAGALEGETNAFWAAVDERDYDREEGLYVELRPVGEDSCGGWVERLS